MVGEGEGSFYGPKIDLHVTDVLGRSWQLGTIQLDRQMPAALRAHLHGRRQRTSTRVFVIHRALFGSLERFIGILIEHYARRVPVLARAGAGAHHPGRRGAPRGGRAAARAARRGGYRVEVDERDETVGKRIRDAELEKVPFTLVWGDKESDERSPSASAAASSRTRASTNSSSSCARLDAVA